MELQQLTERVLVLEASKDYFATSIAMQTGIYTVIIGAIIALFYLQYKNKIKSEVEKQIKRESNKIKDTLFSEFYKETKNYRNEFEKELALLNETQKQNKKSISFLKGENSRSLAFISADKGLHETSFQWWMNAAKSFIDAENEKLIKISLDAAKREMQKIKDKHIKLTMQSIKSVMKEIESLDSELYSDYIKSMNKILDELLQGS